MNYRTKIVAVLVCLILSLQINLLIQQEEVSQSPLLDPSPTTRAPGDLTIEIAANGADDDGDGSTDEPGAIPVDGRITHSTDHTGKTFEFYAAGRVVDEISFGYTHWNTTTGDSYDPDGDLNDRDNLFGEHNGTKAGSVNAQNFFWSGAEVSWDFWIPKAGYYIWTIYSWTSSGNGRYISPRYWNGTHKVTLQDNHDAIDMWLLQFNQSGNHRFYAFGRDRNYMFHSQLSYVREDPISTYGAHPRIATNASDLSNFQNKLNRNWIKLLRDDTVNDAYNLIAGDVNAANIDDPRGTEGRLSDLGVAYLATGDNSIAGWGIQYLQRVLNRTHWMPGASWSYLGIGEYGLGVAIAYDAFFPVMSTVDKEHILNRADMLYNYIFINSINSEHRGDNSHWWSDQTANNWNAVTNGGGLGTGALSFYGDNLYADQWLEQAIQTQRWFLEKCLDDDGAYEESIMYQGYACSSTCLFMQSLLENHQIDIFRYNDHAMKKGAYYNLYFFEPNRQDDSPFDDQTRWDLTTGNTYVGPPDAFWFAVARVYRDGQMQRFCRMVYGDMMACDRYHDYAGYLARCLLSYAEIPEVEAEQWDIPLTEVWPDFGRVCMRTGFNDTQDYYLALQSGLYGSHGAADQSSFIIHALGQVLVDDNYYGNPPTSFHNAILVDGQGQKETPDPEYPGQIDSFFRSSVVDYSLANSTNGYRYNGLNISKNHRNVLFVRPTEDTGGYYIIADDIASNASHTYEWALHHQTNGHTVEEKGNGHYLFNNTFSPVDGPDLEIQFATGDVEMTYSGDRMAVTPNDPFAQQDFTVLLFPTNTTTTLPNTQRFNSTQFSGFTIGLQDLVLFNKDRVYAGHSGVHTDGALTLVRTTGSEEMVSLLNGSHVSASSLELTISRSTNLALIKDDKNYTIDIGDGIEQEGTIDLNLSGMELGIYEWSLDGASQGEFESDGWLQMQAVLTDLHTIEIEYKGPIPKEPSRLRFIDHTPENGTSGDPFQFNVTLIDKDDIQQVYIRYHYNFPPSRNPFNLTMNYLLSEDRWLYDLDLPDVFCSFYYNISVQGKDGRWNSTGEKYLPVLDNDPPFADAGDDVMIYAGEEVVFYPKKAEDVYKPASINVTWEFEHNGTQVKIYGPPYNKTFSFEIPGSYNVTMTVRDDAGLTATDNFTVTVLKLPPKTPPEIEVEYPEWAYVNETITVNVTVTDDDGVAYIDIWWRTPLPPDFKGMIPPSTGTLSFDIPAQDRPTNITFWIIAADTKDTWNGTEEFIIRIIERPPVIVPDDNQTDDNQTDDDEPDDDIEPPDDDIVDDDIIPNATDDDVDDDVQPNATDDDDDEDTVFASTGWIFAVIGLIVILIAAILVIFLVIASRRKKEVGTEDGVVEDGEPPWVERERMEQNIHESEGSVQEPEDMTQGGTLSEAAPEDQPEGPALDETMPAAALAKPDSPEALPPGEEAAEEELNPLDDLDNILVEDEASELDDISFDDDLDLDDLEFDE